MPNTGSMPAATTAALTDEQLKNKFIEACQNDLPGYAGSLLDDPRLVRMVDIFATVIEHDAVKVFGKLIDREKAKIQVIPDSSSDKRQAEIIGLQKLVLLCLYISLVRVANNQNAKTLPKIAHYVLGNVPLSREGIISPKAKRTQYLPVLRNSMGQDLATIVLAAAQTLSGKLADDLYALYWQHQEPVFTAQQANEKIPALLAIPGQELAVTRFVVDAPHIHGQNLSPQTKADLTKNILCSNDPALWRAAAAKHMVCYGLDEKQSADAKQGPDKKQSALAFYAIQCQSPLVPLLWQEDMITAIIQSAASKTDKARLAQVLRDPMVQIVYKAILRKALIKLAVPLPAPTKAERAVFTGRYPRAATKVTLAAASRKLFGERRERR